MNVEVYKLLDSAKINNYDQSDMGEPGTLYIPPLEVPKNGPGNLWGTKTTTTIGGGPHRQSQKARYAYTIERPKQASHPPSAERLAWQNRIFPRMNRWDLSNSNGSPLENETTNQASRSNRSASDEDARLEFPPITPSSNNSTST